MATMNPQALLNVIQAEELVERLLQIRGTQFTPIENALCTEAADLIKALLSTTADRATQDAVLDTGRAVKAAMASGA